MRPAPWAHFRLHPLLARSSSLQTPCRFPLHLHVFPSSSSCASSPPTLPASFLSFAPFLKTPSNAGKIALVPLSPPIITTGMASSSASSWRCSRCTYLNPPTQKSLCEVCLSPSISSPSRAGLAKLAPLPMPSLAPPAKSAAPKRPHARLAWIWLMPSMEPMIWGLSSALFSFPYSVARDKATRG